MKTFLSIGTGPGMGYATAERFAREGFRVILSARNAEKTRNLAEQLKAKGHVAEIQTVDVSDPASIAALIATVEKQHGAIDVVHYNAANLRQADIHSQPQETFNGDLAVNIGGALVATQAATPGMMRNGSGTLLYTGGGFAMQPHPDFLSISVGKAGLRALVLGLFENMKEQNIHVATVTVSALVSPGSKEATDVAEEFWKLYSQPGGSWTAETVYVPG